MTTMALTEATSSAEGTSSLGFVDWCVPTGATTPIAIEKRGDGASNSSLTSGEEKNTTKEETKRILDPDEIWNIIQKTQIFEKCPYPRTLSKPMKGSSNNLDDSDKKQKAGPVVTIAMISDTHSKHNMFGGYEVPLKWFDITSLDDERTSPSCISAITYLNNACQRQPLMQTKVLDEIRFVVNKTYGEGPIGDANTENDNNETTSNNLFLFRPLPIRRQGGLVHTSDHMAIMPVMQLSDDKQSIVAPTEWIGNCPKQGPSADAVENYVEDSKETTRDEYPIIPYTDILIHGGDMTMKGGENEFERFVGFMSQLPHRYKIVVGGNHDLTLDEEYVKRYQHSTRWKHLKGHDNPSTLKEHLKQRFMDSGIIYLENDMISIDTASLHSLKVGGSAMAASSSMRQITIFGSPSQPEYCDWAFQIQRGQDIKEYWRHILPSKTDVDILITHGPPLGRADRVFLNQDEFYQQLATAMKKRKHDEDVLEKEKAFEQMPYIRVGCPHLLWEVQHNVKPKLHCFGHIHEDAHVSKDSYDGTTLFVNACLAGHRHELCKGSHVKTLCLPVD